jgi:hypothetical protein
LSEPPKDPIKKLKWFSDFIENLPQARGEGVVNRMVELQTSRLVARAGDVAFDAIEDQKQEKPGVARGINRGLEATAEDIIKDKLTATDPISSKILGAIGDSLAEDLKAKLTGGSGLQGEDARELLERRRKDELNVLFGQIKEELIQPLAEQIETVAKKVEENPKGTGGALTTEDAVEMVMNAQERAKELLKKQGFSVESVNVTKEDVAAMLDKERAEQTQREAKLKETWEQESGAQVVIEGERIKATENILSGVVDKVFDIFLAPLKGKIEEAIEKGAFRAAPAGQ